MTKNLFASYMRTLVPYGVALVLTGTGWLGIPVDSEAAAGAVSLGLGAAYYGAFRGLEWVGERLRYRPLQLAAGALLGWARPPVYEPVAAAGTAEGLAAMHRALGDKDRR
ncbi:hypothetical protein [Streptomyces pseudovenezuelae]|uniref:hypothetical protein n=1 Tax=Streptomyces pseudovenezuelae TaxID=67350 RepID=UPI0036E33CFC